MINIEGAYANAHYLDVEAKIMCRLAPSMCKYVKRFGLSRAHKVPPVLYKVCRKTKFFVTLSWIWNEVKMKGMMHIYNECTSDWHQVCANMWSGLGWVVHTKYHLSYIKYAKKQFGLSRAHKVPPTWTHTRTWILCPPFRVFVPREQNQPIQKHTNIKHKFFLHIAMITQFYK